MTREDIIRQALIARGQYDAASRYQNTTTTTTPINIIVGELQDAATIANNNNKQEILRALQNQLDTARTNKNNSTDKDKKKYYATIEERTNQLINDINNNGYDPNNNNQRLAIYKARYPDKKNNELKIKAGIIQKPTDNNKTQTIIPTTTPALTPTPQSTPTSLSEGVYIGGKGEQVIIKQGSKATTAGELIRTLKDKPYTPTQSNSALLKNKVIGVRQGNNINIGTQTITIKDQDNKTIQEIKKQIPYTTIKNNDLVYTYTNKETNTPNPNTLQRIQEEQQREQNYNQYIEALRIQEQANIITTPFYTLGNKPTPYEQRTFIGKTAENTIKAGLILTEGGGLAVGGIQLGSKAARIIDTKLNTNSKITINPESIKPTTPEGLSNDIILGTTFYLGVRKPTTTTTTTDLVRNNERSSLPVRNNERASLPSTTFVTQEILADIKTTQQLETNNIAIGKVKYYRVLGPPQETNYIPPQENYAATTRTKSISQTRKISQTTPSITLNTPTQIITKTPEQTTYSLISNEQLRNTPQQLTEVEYIEPTKTPTNYQKAKLETAITTYDELSTSKELTPTSYNKQKTTQETNKQLTYQQKKIETQYKAPTELEEPPTLISLQVNPKNNWFQRIDYFLSRRFKKGTKEIPGRFETTYGQIPEEIIPEVKKIIQENKETKKPIIIQKKQQPTNVNKEEPSIDTNNGLKLLLLNEPIQETQQQTTKQKTEQLSIQETKQDSKQESMKKTEQNTESKTKNKILQEQKYQQELTARKQKTNFPTLSILLSRQQTNAAQQYQQVPQYKQKQQYQQEPQYKQKQQYQQEPQYKQETIQELSTTNTTLRSPPRNEEPPTPPPFLNPPKPKKRRVLFDLQLRKRGKFRTIASGLDVEQSVRQGSTAIDMSEAASFRIVEQNTNQYAPSQALSSARSFINNTFIRQSKRDSRIFVEKNKYRINTIGEKTVIRPKRSFF